MVVSIPVTHPDAPPRNGMVRGFYESIEMIREIPLQGTAESDSETNPVEWTMVTRSDPGGGIPRFMVERNVPSSIVMDAVKFLDWACAKDESITPNDLTAGENDTADALEAPGPQRKLSMVESNGITAGIGTSIADRPSPSVRRLSQRPVEQENVSQEGILAQIRHSVEAYIPDAYNPLQRTVSSSSSSTSSSVESFASAEQFRTAPDGLPTDHTIVTSSSTSEQSVPIVPEDSPHAREMQKIEERKRQLKEKLEQAREKQSLDLQSESQKTQKEIEKAAEKHERDRKKQEEKFQKEIDKLEQRREKETRKLLARQQKEADKNQLGKAQRERDEYKARVDILEEENKLLKEQIGGLQKENTAIVARLGKTDRGLEILKLVQEEDMVGRTRASSRASKSSEISLGLKRSGTQGSVAGA